MIYLYAGNYREATYYADALRGLGFGKSLIVHEEYRLRGVRPQPGDFAVLCGTWMRRPVRQWVLVMEGLSRIETLYPDFQVRYLWEIPTTYSEASSALRLPDDQGQLPQESATA